MRVDSSACWIELKDSRRQSRFEINGEYVAWIPLLMPGALQWVEGCCAEGTCSMYCSAACATSGLIVGFWLARIHSRLGHRGIAWLVSAGVVLVASIAGCHCVGFSTTLTFLATLMLSGAFGKARFRSVSSDRLVSSLGEET